MFSRTGFWGWAAMLASLALVSAVVGDNPSADSCKPGQLTVSKETTYFTEPLREDGTVDYIAALNAKFGEGVTPENNAAVLLLRAIGPGYIPDSVGDDVLERMGVGELPPDGDYLPFWGEWNTEPDSFEEYQSLTKRPWRSEDSPDSAAAIEDNGKLLDTICRAANRPRCFFPLVRNHDAGGMIQPASPLLGATRNAARWLLARAMLRLGENRPTEAWADILAVHRLARLVGTDGFLFNYLVALSLEGEACTAGRELALSARLSAGRLRRCIEELNAIGPEYGLRDILDSNERCFGLDYALCFRSDALAMLARLEDVDDIIGVQWRRHKAEPQQIAPFFEPVCWDETLRLYNSRIDSLVEAGGKPTWAQRREAMAEWELARDELKAELDAGVQRTGGLAQYLRPPNDLSPHNLRRHSRRVGLFLSFPTADEAFDFQYSRAFEIDTTQRADFRMYKLVFAAAAYRAERGAYPPKPAELVPDYLDELPPDPFTDEPFRYERTDDGFLLYSVGPSMTDHGGSEDEEQGHDDIVIRVPFAEE